LTYSGVAVIFKPEIDSDMSDDKNKKSGRIIGIYGPRVEILGPDGAVSASMRGKLKYGDSGKSLMSVGDYVEYSAHRKGQAAIESILPRQKTISRPAVEKEGKIQIIVSNVDRMVIVTSVRDPEFRPGAVDRFLVIAFKEEIHPVVVFNKTDLADPAEFENYIVAWKAIGCEILCTSARTGEHIEEFKHALTRGTSVVVGHSGVGKSSLLNRVNPELHIRTGRISAYSGRGVHTTSRVNLFKISPEGWVADTPGLRDLGLVGISRKNLYLYYPEFAPLRQECQFGNCVHVDEPGCAVKKALGEGKSKIYHIRYEGYLNIYRSL
jgi:ribosome biogenesis GTPase